MRLVNGNKAVVDLRKLSDYCLSLIHPRGKHKAAVFRAALGLTSNDAPALQSRLKQAARQEPVIVGSGDEYGDRYPIDFEMVTQSGRAVIRSAWMIRASGDFPRFVTCYILSK